MFLQQRLEVGDAGFEVVDVAGRTVSARAGEALGKPYLRGISRLVMGS